MSNRSIIEFNHDYAPRISSSEFTYWMTLWLNSCDEHAKEMLEMMGVKIHGVSHHSDKPWAEVIRDGKGSAHCVECEVLGVEKCSAHC